LFSRRSLRLDEKVVYYSVTKNGNENEVALPYENVVGYVVSWDISRVWMLHTGILGAVLGFFLLMSVTIVGISVLVIGAVLIVAYFVTRESYWKIACQNGEFIYLYKAVPDAETVSAFIEALLEKRNAYMRTHYGQLNKGLPYEQQYSNLQWLRSIDVFSEQEFRQRENELNELFHMEERPIGFFAK
jgi:hypothetical protein